jgi:hypothetical protein
MARLPKGYIRRCDCDMEASIRVNGHWICERCFIMDKNDGKRTAAEANNKRAYCTDYYTVLLPRRGLNLE